MNPQEEVTQLILSCAESAGSNSESSERLFAMVYEELHRLAESRLKNERLGHTLQPTALVHEVYLRLVAPDMQRNWNNTGHFFGAAAQAMRRILIENARKKLAIKRGGGLERVEMSVGDGSVSLDDEQLVELHDALNELAIEDPQKAKLVELRFFGGLSVEQACDVLGISRATAHRYWTFARAWLYLRVADSRKKE